MASPTKRWVFDTEDLPRLLRESKQYKGESLWQDAWRRLRRIRSAWWSLVFIALFGATALLAPLLPIPSPTAFTLAGVPQPPKWAGWAQQYPGDWTDALNKLERGNQPTQVALGGSFDNGWRHRSVASFEVPAGEGEAAAEALTQWVERESGRKGSYELRAGDGVDEVHVAIPCARADTDRVTQRATGREGTIHTSIVSGGIGMVVTLDAELPIDPERIAGFDSSRAGLTRRLYLFERDAGEGASPILYEFEQQHDEEWIVLALVVNGVEIEHADADRRASAGLRTLDEAEEDMPVGAVTFVSEDFARLQVSEALGAARFDPALLTEPGDVSITIDARGERQRLFERRSVRATESREARADGLRRRLEASAADGLPAGATLASVRVYDLYEWDTGDEEALSPFSPGDWFRGFDRALLSLRGDWFGLWQTSNWLGTDSGGRDLFARIVWGSRTSILVALAATLCSLVIGVTYGAFSGLMGGRIDNLMMRFVDILYSVPFIFVVIFLITIVGEYRAELEDQYGIDREVVFFVVIGAIYWLTMARVVRGQVLSLKNSEFVEAARVVGASTTRILFSHLVPNVLSIVIVYLTLTIPAVMLFEAFLSFLGLGIEPPKVSWGLLASDSTEAISSVRTYWWLVAFPAAAMGASLLALNVLGDGLRDALDPKLRGKD